MSKSQSVKLLSKHAKVMKEAVKKAGSFRALSKEVGIGIGTLHRVSTAQQVMGFRSVKAVCKYLNNKYTPEELRPDIYGE